MQNMVQRADGMLPPAMPGYNPDVEGLAFDPAKALELIGQSRYGSVAGLPPIVLTSSGRGEQSPINEAIVAMWKQNLGR